MNLVANMYSTSEDTAVAVGLDHADPTSGMTALPAELINMIASELSSRDLLVFRFAARVLYAHTFDAYRAALNNCKCFDYTRSGLELLSSVAKHPYLLRGYVEIWFPPHPQRDAMLLMSTHRDGNGDAWRTAKALADNDRRRSRRGNVLAEKLTEALLCLERREKGVIVRFKRLSAMSKCLTSFHIAKDQHHTHTMQAYTVVHDDLKVQGLDTLGSLATLPCEILDIVIDHVAHEALLSLRLASRHLFSLSLDAFCNAYFSQLNFTYSRLGLGQFLIMAQHPYILRRLQQLTLHTSTGRSRDVRLLATGNMIERQPSSCIDYDGGKVDEFWTDYPKREAEIDRALALRLAVAFTHLRRHEIYVATRVVPLLDQQSYDKQDKLIHTPRHGVPLGYRYLTTNFWDIPARNIEEDQDCRYMDDFEPATHAFIGAVGASQYTPLALEVGGCDPNERANCSKLYSLDNGNFRWLSLGVVVAAH
ncbi:hypothetical protein LTR95_006586 [Oleoguttula sp. CCFEE 5521]